MEAVEIKTENVRHSIRPKQSAGLGDLVGRRRPPFLRRSAGPPVLPSAGPGVGAGRLVGLLHVHPGVVLARVVVGAVGELAKLHLEDADLLGPAGEAGPGPGEHVVELKESTAGSPGVAHAQFGPAGPAPRSGRPPEAANWFLGLDLFVCSSVS